MVETTQAPDPSCYFILDMHIPNEPLLSIEMVSIFPHTTDRFHLTTSPPLNPLPTHDLPPEARLLMALGYEVNITYLDEEGEQS